MAYTDLNKRRKYFRTSNRRKQHEFEKLKEFPCVDCSGRFPPECMDFDHRPNEKKVGRVSTLVRGTLDKLMDEIRKCDLVCANCHRIRTRKRIELK
jgi:hypothetical protein